MGRRLLLSPTQTKQLCALLAQAVPLSTAAEALGIAPRTLRGHLQAAAENDANADLVALSARIARARARGRVRLVRYVAEAAKRDWRAACFLLSRASPEEFGVRAMEGTFPPASLSFSHSYHTNGDR